VLVVDIPVSAIDGWDAFHDVFATALGFPEFYGRNMNAWIDCLTYADEDDGMRAVHVGPGEVLTLHLVGVKGFRTRAPEIYEALLDCAAFVNWRRIDVGDPPVLALAYSTT
jgi:hypothetical protein